MTLMMRRCASQMQALDFGGAPYWAFPGSYIDVDFANLRSWGCNFFAPGISSALEYPGDIIATTGASNIVYLPDATGLLIIQPINQTRWTRGMGIWGFTSYNNVCLFNRALTNAAWVQTNVTVSQNQIGADGTTNGAASITASAAGGTILQTVTAVSAAFVGSCDVKRLSGSGQLLMTINGGTTWTPVSVGSTYSQISVPALTQANPVIGFQIASSGDSFAIDFVKCDSNALGLIQVNPARNITTTVAVQSFNEEPEINSSVGKPNDGLRIVNDVFMRGAPWTGYFENSGNAPAACSNVQPDAGVGFFVGGAGGDAGVQGTATTANTGNFGLGNWNRGAVSLNAHGNRICLNAGPIASGGSVPSPPGTGMTHLGVGNSAAGSKPLNGPTRRLTIWQYEMPNGFLQEITRLPA